MKLIDVYKEAQGFSDDQIVNLYKVFQEIGVQDVVSMSTGGAFAIIAVKVPSEHNRWISFGNIEDTISVYEGCETAEDFSNAFWEDDDFKFLENYYLEHSDNFEKWKDIADDIINEKFKPNRS